MQSGVDVIDDHIKGRLKYVSDYTGFSSNPDEQHGNYIALKVNGVPADAVVTYEKVGGSAAPVTLDADRNIVIIVKDLTAILRFTATYNGETVVKDYDISRLVLDPAPAEESNAEEEIAG